MEIRWEKVVAVEHGEWSNEQQDYRAVLVFDAGGKLETDLWCSQASEKMQVVRMMDVGIFSLMASFEKRLDKATDEMDQLVLAAKDSFIKKQQESTGRLMEFVKSLVYRVDALEAKAKHKPDKPHKPHKPDKK